MKKGTFKLALLAGLVAVTAISCKKEGCTDATANNYNEEAKKDELCQRAGFQVFHHNE